MVKKSIILIGFLALVSCVTLNVNGKTVITKLKSAPATCYKCVSTAHGDACDSDPSTITTTCDADTTIPACYTYLEIGFVKRSCDAPATGCTPPYCNKCEDGDNCNDHVFPKRKCITCDSSIVGQSECASEDPVPATFEEECAEYEDVCFTKIDGENTIRGCRTDIAACTADPECAPCDIDGDNCNNQLFPDGRTKCYSCSGNTCVDVTTADIKVCKNYVANGLCYVNVVDDTNFNRGCNSDEDFTAKCTGECTFCKSDYPSEENNDKTRDEYQCYVCNSETMGQENCAIVTTGYEGDCEVLMGRPQQCYWYEDGDKFSRGCISSFSGCEADVKCTPTDGPLSNQKNNLEKCIKCEGPGACESDPSSLPPTDCPVDAVKSGCYHQIDVNGKHIRGCASELTIDPDECAGGGDTMCNICEGDNCNANDFQRCQKCSTLGSGCETGGTGIPLTTCPDYSDKCFIHVDVEGVTHRGCEQELGVTCGASDCKECDTDCTDDIFPTGRTECYTCTIEDGEDCFKEQTDPNNLKVCEKYVAGDECFIVVEELNKAERGCVSDNNVVCTGSDHCETYPSKMNGLDGITTGKCYKCSYEDVALDPSCNNNLNTEIDCKGLLGIGPECYYYQDGDVFERGCLEEATGDIADKCKNEDPNCHITKGDYSNDKTDVVQCITCDSEKGQKCKTESDLEDIPPAKCQALTSDDDNLCYLRIDGDGNTKRGCYSDLDAAGKVECDKNEICKTCTGDSCNKKVAFQKCFICDSDTTPQCAETGSGEETCDDYMDKCGILVTEGGKTDRGCRPLDATCENNDLCYVCEGGNCNGILYPADRSKCHQCASTDPNCSTNIAAVLPTICRNYKSDEKCYSALTADEKIARGCLSDIGSDAICKTDENCETCDAINTDGCNKHLDKCPTKLKCIQCTSDKAECAWEYDESTGESCKNPIELGKKEWCYRHKTTDNKVVRGCGQNDEKPCGADEGNEETCKKCESDGCNYEYVVNSKCKVCDSADDEKCKDNANDLPNSDCTNNQLYENRGCFTQVTDGNTKRGCFSDLSPDEMTKCEDNGDNSCVKCLLDGCNEHLATNPSKLKCIQCTSDEAECAWEYDESTGESCKNPIELGKKEWCYRHKTTDNKVVRGCGQNDEKPCGADEGNEETCKKCESDGCNYEYVVNSKCKVCDSVDDEKCKDNANDLPNSDCTNNQLYEKRGCFTQVIDGNTKRGCFSDLSPDEMTKCEDNGDNSCVKCLLDGCNEYLATNPSKLKCIKCTSDEAECAWEYDESTGESCKNPIELGKKEWCYRHKTTDNKVVRGCGQNDEKPCGADEGNEETCKKCESDGCNYEYVVNSKCKVCDSADDEKCKDNANELPNSDCTANQFYENRGCFTQVIDGNTKRGCFADLSLDEMTKCKDNDDNSCVKCLPDGCNNSATALQILSITLVGTVFILVKNFI